MHRAALCTLAKRTARNDLNELSNKQIFKRIGETNLAKYVLD
jgi:Fic family protein